MRNPSLRKRRPSVIAQETGNPFGDYQYRFQRYLETQGYAPGYVAEYRRCLTVLAMRMQGHGVAIGAFNELEPDEVLARVKWSSSRRRSAGYMVRHFVRFLIGQGLLTPIPKPVVTATLKEKGRARLRKNYETYLRHQRGLSEATIEDAWRCVDHFLDFHFGDEVGNLSKITAVDIARFIQHLHSKRRPYRVTIVSTNLRRFFQFLFKVGETTSDLALSIPSVARRYQTLLPRHLAPEQVEDLLAAVRCDHSRRNYAMFVLLARLGLRAKEVVAVQIDDIDWRAGEIIIRGKGGLHDRVPLPQDVGEALTDYIRLERVSTSRGLFVSRSAPHRPIKDTSLLNAILKRAFLKTGLKPPAPHVGSHVLRHSLATNLLQRGASMEEIGNMLRHRSRISTMVYARLDVEGLRSIAQPWPVVGGAK